MLNVPFYLTNEHIDSIIKGQSCSINVNFRGTIFNVVLIPPPQMFKLLTYCPKTDETNTDICGYDSDFDTNDIFSLTKLLRNISLTKSSKSNLDPIKSIKKKKRKTLTNKN
jgi:hypothetical protein